MSRLPLVERTTRFLVLVRVEGKDTKSVVDGLIREVQQLPEQLWRSLTWDRGTELAQHKRFTLDTNINVFFCDPRSPWQPDEESLSIVVRALACLWK